MSISSGQITDRLKRSNTPEKDKQALFERTRYFVGQQPVREGYSGTKPGYFHGRKVIPGPKANPKVSIVLNEQDVRLLERKYFIRFVDNKTTIDASEDLKRALLTIMDDKEADEYEAVLKELKDK